MGALHRQVARRRVIAAGIAALFLASLATGAVFRSSVDVLDSGECGSAWTGTTTAIVIDASNPLAARSEATVRAVLAQAAQGSQGSRVIVARVTGAPEYAPEILFDRCDPLGTGEQRSPIGGGQGRRREERRESFIEPLQQALRTVVRPVRDNRQSYLADTLMRVVADPAMHITEGSTVVLVSDIIENTVRSTPYLNRRIVLPEIREPFLSDIEVRIVELPAMPGATHLQTFELRSQWRGWLTRAGSPRVTVASPGLARPES